MQWGTLDNFTKYTISDTGLIRNIRTGKIMKTGIDRYGYEKIKLTSDGGTACYTTVHRCVARVFLVNDNPVVKFQVNHIDGVKNNNFAMNLEWASAKTNINHSYEFNLNSNKNAIEVYDLETQITTEYRSVKFFARLLGSHAGVLMPLIKHSSINPILNRYVVKILDVDALEDRANVKNFGRCLYVFDSLTGETKVYQSINLASYHTGIRTMGATDAELRLKPYIEKIGFIMAFNESNIPKGNCSDADNIKALREAYHRRPHVFRNHTYKAYDYIARKEHVFESVKDLLIFLNGVDPVDRVLTLGAVSCSLSNSSDGKNAITKGIGIRSSLHFSENDGWFNYSEAEVLRSKYNIPHRTVVFRIRKDDTNTLAFGMVDLCSKIGYDWCRSLPYPTLQEILDSLNDPKLHVERVGETINVS